MEVMEQKELNIPYRLEDAAAIRKAMNINLLNIGPAGYKRMLALANTTKLQIPEALKKARKSVEKDFFLIREKKIKQCNAEYSEIANLDLIHNFSLIERTLPWIKIVAHYNDLFSYISTMSEEIKSHCRLKSHPSLETVLILRKLLRQEILSYTRRKKTKCLDVQSLKQIIVAYTLTVPGNEDIIRGIRAAEVQGKQSTLYQNALAELLFHRLPRFIDELVAVDVATIRKKLFSKMENLQIAKRQQMNLWGYFKSIVPRKDLFPTLDKIDAVAQKTYISEEMKQKLHNYIVSLKRNIEVSRSTYQAWFLNSELRVMQKLHIPRRVMKTNLTYNDLILKTYTKVTNLQFYPTKDYLDLYKCNFSSDCTTRTLGEAQLLVPNFFNIRIFKESRWMGNIYLLDFTEEQGVLLIDRIQIPRGLDADYVYFFKYLKEAFEYLFGETEYKFILMPKTISNHYSVQKTFNEYKNSLRRRKIDFKTPYRQHFEGIKSRHYYILCNRG